MAAADALKKPQSAYWLWLAENRDKIASCLGTGKGSEVAKKGGEMWKALSEAAKRPYEAKAKAQKDAYDKLLSTSEGQKLLEEKKAAKAEEKAEKTQKAEAIAEKKAAKEERKNERDCKVALKSIVKDDALKKPLTAYWLWLSDNRDKIAAAAGSKNVADVGKKGGEMWKALSDAAKKPYENKAKEQKDKYDKYVASEAGQAALKAFKDAKQATKDQFKPKETSKPEEADEDEPVKEESPKKRKAKEVVASNEQKDSAADAAVQPKKARGRPPKVQTAKLGA